MANIQTSFLSANQALLASGTSPVPSVGDNLFTFMANRLSMSFANLGGQDYGLTNPVTVTVDGNGVATAATFDTRQQTATGSGLVRVRRPPGQRMGHHRHKVMNPAGM